jgi:hypothetical protein
MDTQPPQPADLEQFLEHLARIAQHEDELPEEDTPAGILTREFLANNWAMCCDGLLSKTSVIRVFPENSPAPRRFRFEVDCPYKRKAGADAPVELMPGPVRGTIHYRPDMFLNPLAPHIAVQIDPDLAYLHPNCERRRGCLVCLGELPTSPFPFPLDLLLENHLYPILTYQNRRPAHPLDLEAARYFALDSSAMDGLEPVKPLY